jgi:hypothetical protein
MTAALRAQGFTGEGPSKHFEVPGGWCLSATRATTPAFDPMRSLEAVCAIGHASRAYFTGGQLRTRNGATYEILSTYDRQARAALAKRLGK